jgi:uncharacterized Zn-finger protein
MDHRTSIDVNTTPADGDSFEEEFPEIQDDLEDKPFVCTYHNCGKRFKLQAYLSRHLSRHLPTDLEEDEGIDEISEVDDDYAEPRIDNSFDSTEVNENTADRYGILELQLLL